MNDEEYAQLLGLDNEQLAAVLGESGDAAHPVDTNGAPAASPGSTPHAATATYSLDNLVTVAAASIALVVTTISGTALPGNEAGARPTELDRLVEAMKRRGLMPLFRKARSPCSGIGRIGASGYRAARNIERRELRIRKTDNARNSV